MSLMQLLTTGKALEGLHDSSHRYQMTNHKAAAEIRIQAESLCGGMRQRGRGVPGEPVPVPSACGTRGR